MAAATDEMARAARPASHGGVSAESAQEDVEMRLDDAARLEDDIGVAPERVPPQRHHQERSHEQRDGRLQVDPAELAGLIPRAITPPISRMPRFTTSSA